MDGIGKQSLVSKLRNLVLPFRRRKMSETPEFKATDVINHRYADASVLTRMLISFEIPKKQIKLQATEEKGFEMQLPRKLTDKEMQMILEEFEAEHVRRKIARQRPANSA